MKEKWPRTKEEKLKNERSSLLSKGSVLFLSMEQKDTAGMWLTQQQSILSYLKMGCAWAEAEPVLPQTKLVGA